MSTESVYNFPRAMGKTFMQFQNFVAECKAGKKIQWHGKDYVMIDRKSWDEIQRKLNKAEIKIISGEVDGGTTAS